MLHDACERIPGIGRDVTGPDVTTDKDTMKSAAAGDLEYGTGDEGRGGGQQKNDGFGDLAGSAGTAHRDSGSESTEPAGITRGSVNVRFNQPRRNGVDANAFGRDLPGQANRQGVDSRFTGSIVDPFASRTELRGARRDVDDHAAAATVLGRKTADRFAAAEEGPATLTAKGRASASDCTESTRA